MPRGRSVHPIVHPWPELPSIRRSGPRPAILSGRDVCALVVFALVLFTMVQLCQGALLAQPPTTEADASAQEERRSKRAERRAARAQEKLDEERYEERRQALVPDLREFLDTTQFLMTSEERRVFLELGQSYQQRAFIRAFWKTRDPFPETARNELREAVEANIQIVRDTYEGDLTGERARVMLLTGPPEQTRRSRCELTRTLETWYFRESLILRGEVYVVFIRQGGDYELWSPTDGLMPIMALGVTSDDAQSAERIATECPDGDDIIAALAMSIDLEALLEDSPRFKRPGAEWAQSFLASTTDLPEGAELLNGSLSVQYPSRHQSRTVMQAIVEVERSGVEVVATGKKGAEDGSQGKNKARFLVDGDILRDGELFESFRYRFDLPVEADTERLPVVVERYLRPGSYDLVLRVRDTIGDRYLRQSQTLEVPRIARPGRTVHSELAIDRVLEEANAEPLSGISLDPADDDQGEGDEQAKASVTRLVLRSPSEQLLTGRTRIEATAEGANLARVAFELNGKAIMSKARPPYSVEIDLGKTPRTHTVTAIALDSEGTMLARDEVVLNSGPHSFDVRLVSPQPGKEYRRSVRAAAEVDVPELGKLDRLEFFLNDTLVTSIFQPPFVQPILIPEGQDLSYVRVVAYLADGTSVEDVVFVNAPDLLDRVDINMVELFVSVLDKKGRPALGLTEGNFVVKENGEPQKIRRFELVDDLPIHAGILLDLSLSMEDNLEDAEKAALYFFEEVLEERDRGCLITFSDEPELQVPFTNSSEILAGGLAGLVADGNTALYDSLVFTLHYFAGLKGKRALVVLSDGEDDRSEYSYDDVIEFARRTGVALYTIGIDLDRRQVDVNHRLTQLARETGGRHFSTESSAGLTRIYDKIKEELRSQYLIAYQSNVPTSGKVSTKKDMDSEFHEIEIEITGQRTGVDGETSVKGLRATTLRGYYP